MIERAVDEEAVRRSSCFTLVMIARVLLALLALVAAPAAADEVNLFPKRALASVVAPSDVATSLPPDSPWRAVERNIGSQFSPTVVMVTDENPAALLAKQLARRRDPAPAPVDRSTEHTLNLSTSPADKQLLREQKVDAAQTAYEEPATWRRVEVEATVDATGVIDARVVLSSHRDRLDTEALAAVRHAVGAAHDLGSRGAVVARFAVEAGAAVMMPVRSITHEVRGRPNGIMVNVAKGRFGDGKKTEVSAPLQPVVRTRVQLLSLTSVR